MRILMLNHNVPFVGGGTFYRAFELGRFMARRGHTVTLLSSSKSQILRFRDKQIDGVRLVECPGILPTKWRYGYDYYESFRRINWIANLDFDIVHAFDSRPTVIYPALFAKKHGARLIMDWCDWFGRGGSVEERTNPLLRSILRPLENYYEENFRRYADATTVISPTLERRALEMGIPATSILQLPNGIDPKKLIPKDRAKARHRLSLPSNVPIIGYLGSLFPSDADLMLQAFYKVKEIQTNAQLILIGNPKSKIPEIDGITVTGFIYQKDLNDYLAACDILWLPLSDTIANRGRWPSKIVDYFAVGRPTVACAVGDLTELLKNTQAGVTSAANSDDFAKLTLSIMKNSQWMDRLGNNARRVIEIELNWEILAEAVEEHYLKRFDGNDEM